MWDTPTFCWMLRMVPYIYKMLDTAILILYMAVVNISRCIANARTFHAILKTSRHYFPTLHQYVGAAV
jgi:hypothetical protein